ncbi:hypothetical protein BDW60DRAFT_195817 [Aspergillus nidulans var. acristatus]
MQSSNEERRQLVVVQRGPETLVTTDLGLWREDPVRYALHGAHSNYPTYAIYQCTIRVISLMLLSLMLLEVYAAAHV